MFRCTCRPCTQCSCTCNNMENMYCPMDYSVSQQPQPLPQNACMPNMSCLNRSSMQCNAGGYKPNGGVSLNMINSPTRFQPESMCLPGQPICPGKDRGMPCMPCMPNSVPNSGGGQMDPSQACCRPRCMKFM